MKNLSAQSDIFNPRAVFAFALYSCGVLLGTFSFAATPPVALPLAARASLSFEERVAGQRAIEEVYRRHRTPADNTSSKPPLSQVLPEAALRDKVTDALRMSDALSTIWKQPITGEQLQAEIDRMAAASKQPEMLREIWAALGNDPHLIAECLARPQLADRLMRDHYSNDPRFNAAARASAHAERTQYGTVGEMRKMSGTYNVAEFTRAASSEAATGMKLSATQFDAMIQEIAGVFGAGDRLARLAEDDQPFVRSPAIGAFPAGAIPLGRVSEVREDADRFSVIAVLAHDQDHIKLASVEWPKVSFDAWWRSVRDTTTLQIQEPQRAYRLSAISPDGERSDSTASGGTDQWRPIAGMDFRQLASRVWTGSEMIVWGGVTDYSFQFIGPHRDGGRYDPATATWRPISVIGAPTQRYIGVTMPQTVWTGKEMIVWGGFDPISGDNYNDGARYNPSTDTWTPMSTVGAPVPRDSFSIVWTGTEMIVWGGWNGHDAYVPWFLNSGGRYNPETDTWTATSLALAPSIRQHHTAVWTGSKMIVWGGVGPGKVPPGVGTDDLGDGGVYDPKTDTWSLTGTSLVGAPTDRYYPTAVWTGTEMIIWGGRGGTGPTDSGGYDSAGGRYNPTTDTWQPTSTVNVPGQRKWHFAVWTGSEMLVWGGDGPGPNNQNGGRYNPVTDTWVTMNQSGQPPLSYWLSGVWTGSEMLVFGGNGRDDGRYNPATDTWRSMNTPAISQQYAGPYGHSAVWTGSEMIIWGGRSFPTDRQNTGGVYLPSTDTWRLTSTVNAPDPRYAHTAVWTGNEMIVWGGTGSTNTGNTGARYNPASNVWTATSVTASTPAKRGGHTAILTGNEMIVWGGHNGTTAYDSGGRYNFATDTWQPTNLIGAPSARYSHSAVWTGSKMIIWGGGTATATDTGAQYDPATDTWQPTSVAGAPSARSSHTAIWSGNRMIVWGGGSYSGGRYDPAADAWQPMSAIGYSGGVIGDSAVWTGSEMIAWGGGNTNGGRYDPATDVWQPMSIPRFLVGRTDHSAVWTGNSMIVFGGYSMTTTGGVYLPAPIAPIPTSVVSRKTHGAAGTFDVDLPLTGAPGIECRTGGTNNDYQMLVTFANAVTFNSAAVTIGTGSVVSITGNGTTQVTVNLTGVTNAQTITVTLSSVNDGTNTGDVGVRMGVLGGDTNADGFVNSADISQTKSQSGITVSASNFREDVTADGSINSGDISLTKSKSGTALP